MWECLKREVTYRTSRSSGPGGQHVNKTESRVDLIWDLSLSSCMDENQKNRLRMKLSNRITGGGILILSSEKHRSQHQNREEVTERFIRLVTANLVPQKKRYPTRRTRSSVEQRIKSKKIRGELKRTRRHRPGE